MRQVTRAIVQSAQDKILLVKHGPENFWALPGGHIEHGEGMHEAIHREIKEEFNLEVELLGNLDGIAHGREELDEEIKPISIYTINYYSKNAGKDVEKREYIFLARIIGGDIKIQESEIYDFNFFSKNEIVSGSEKIFPQIIDLVKKYVK